MIPQEIRDALEVLLSLAEDSYRSDVALIDKVEQWLRELPVMPEPDWRQAPDWAMWWAVDSDGYCHWFDNHPILHRVTHARKEISPYWAHVGSKMEMYDAVNLPLGIDWRETLRKRPGLPLGTAS